MSKVVHLNGEALSSTTESDDLKYAVQNLLAENVRLSQHGAAVLDRWVAVDKIIARGGDLPEDVAQSILKLDRTRLATAMLEYMKAVRDYTDGLRYELKVPQSLG